MIASYQKFSDFRVAKDSDMNLMAHVLLDQFSLEQKIPYCFPSGLRQISQSSEKFICETWSSSAPVQYGKSGCVVCARDDVALFGCVDLDQALPMDRMVADAYRQVLKTLEQVGFPFLVRVWHYFPRLNQDEQKVSRYQLFCRGRNQALGFKQEADVLNKRCATTVIGTHAAFPSMFFIATCKPGVAIENPAQTNAWDYPQINFDERPLFSRATWSPSLSALFISGTASIVGSESRHTDSSVKQVQQIFTNLDRLLAQSRDVVGKDIQNFACLKVYIRNTDEFESIQRSIQSCLSVRNMHAQTVLTFRGEICREDLAVEIDAMCFV